MFRFLSLAAALLLAGPGLAQDRFAGIGRTATPAEIRAWDIDVRADFSGLPKGSGSVKKGEEVWEAKCASCHGSFGESNSVFAPLVGGTTRDDIRTGRVAALRSPDQPRTMLMKLSRVSTLWDYINRAMPWNAPKTLNVEEVYASVAYILHLGYVVEDDFVLSDANIDEVQQRLPNRNDMRRAHGLWEVRGAADVKNTACMKNCPGDAKVVSQLPAHASGAHGNLAEQHRSVGPVRGMGSAPAAAVPSVRTLAEASGCLACHGVSARIVGPGLHEIAAKYKGTADAESHLTARVKSGSQGVWGSVPMPPNTQLKDDDLRALVKWILGGAG
jgi:S-disulfanyl-L-cysteine oxidoreductase SoxD